MPLVTEKISSPIAKSTKTNSLKKNKLTPYDAIIIECIKQKGIASHKSISKSLENNNKSTKLLSSKLKALKAKDIISKEGGSYCLGKSGKTSYACSDYMKTFQNAKEERYNQKVEKRNTKLRMDAKYAMNKEEAENSPSRLKGITHSLLRKICH